MDRKSLLVLGVSFLLLALWIPAVNYFFPPIPLPAGSNGVTRANNVLPGTNSPRLELSAATNTAAAPVPITRPNAPEELVTFETAQARYTFTSHGGGLKHVALKEYPEVVSCRQGDSAASNQLATLNAAASQPILALRGGGAIEGDDIYALAATATGIRAEKRLSNGLHVIKEFTVTSNYLLRVTTSLANRGAAPIAVPEHEWVVGLGAPISLEDESTLLGVYWQSDAGIEHVDVGWFDNRALGCFPGTPRVHYSAGHTNVQWAATHNQFFALALIPDTPAARVLATRTNLPPPTPAQLAASPSAHPRPFGFQTSLSFTGAILAPGQVLDRAFHLYAGPKEYNTLARISTQLKTNLDSVMGFDTGFGGSVFGFFAKLLLLSMNGLHSWNMPYAITIIVITVIIKLLFWPLTTASTRSMKRMAALQPQMKALQEKYKDDPAKMNRKLMEFMKENKVNPMGGCLPMLLQIPVFIGFFTMVRSAIELRGAQFLWACDLSRSDTIFVIPGVNIPVNPMPLLMGATMIWQARLTPVAPGMDPVQQKIMKYMPLIFIVFLYNYSAGLTLYWTVQNLLTIAQMKLTRTQDAAADTPTPAAASAKPAKPAAPGPSRKKK